MRNRIIGILTVGVLAMGLGWNLGAQQAAATDKADARKWKDNAEYELYDAAAKAADGKARVALLDKWTQGYPQSDYNDIRQDFYLLSYRQVNDCRQTTDWGNKIRATRPNDFQSIAGILGCVYQFNPPAAKDLTNAEAVARYTLDNQAVVFAATNAGSVPPAQWPEMKPLVVALAQKTIAWVPVQQKNDAKSEQEITKYLGIDGTQAAFSYYLSNAILNQVRAKAEPPEKAAVSMFHSARASAYDGPNAMDAANRKQIGEFLKTSYVRYHGSEEGLLELLAVAKVNVFPPPGFSIKDVNVINQEKADALNNARAAHPDLTAWDDFIQKPLKGDMDAMYFKDTLEGVEFPGMAIPGVTSFKGKLISASPMEKPKQLVLAVYDPMVPDTTLTFTDALPGHMDPGADLSFNGVIKSYTKSPLMITFEIAKPTDLGGWTGVNAKGATNTKGAGKGPAPAGKGAPKGKQ